MGPIDQGASHILTLMQMQPVEDPEMGPALEMELRPEVSNPHGSLHGGLMGALIECGARAVIYAALNQTGLNPRIPIAGRNSARGGWDCVARMRP